MKRIPHRFFTKAYKRDQSVTKKEKKESVNSIGIVVSFVLLIILLSTNFWVRNLESEAADLVKLTLAVESDIWSLLSLLQDAETGQRGYLITQKEDYLEPYNTAQTKLDETIADLTKLTRDNPIQQENIRTINKLIRKKLDELAITIELVRNGEFEEATKVVHTNLGKNVMDKIRQEIKGMHDIEALHKKKRFRKLDYLQELEMLGNFLAILLFFAVVVYARKSFTLAQQFIESEKKLATILGNTREGVYGLNLNGRVTFANKAAVEALGYSIEEMVNNSLHDLIHHHYADGQEYPRENCNIYRAVKDGKMHTEDQEVFWKKDGTALPVEYTSKPVHDSNGDIIGAVMVFHDITERKKAEEEILQLLQQNRRLSQRMLKIQEDERRHLARELHDELGQPLAAIHLNAETIKVLSKKQYLKIHECAQVIDETAIDVNKSIHSILRQLRPTFLDDMGLVESIKELVNQWQIRFPTIEIKLSMEGELNDFEDDLNIAIYRIIQESLTNVAKHAKAHKVSVQLIRKPRGIEAQDCLFLMVKDNGKGLDDRFITGGLGLPSLRERVIAIGGKFSINNTKGKGVSIEAQIPINVTLLMVK